ncbi:hypothetical protein PG2093B_0464 [Bifidobacterium pseudolongum subsp. globosum]|uniref:Uncharacterized protein n=1 Tax=Bifidobacterium pseudolongum subsp. globosum TaxID=1690 RepID=A0A4Q5A3E0_9BIFI|nr:DUF4064 domain-containing protein [Bifidobacterium pseudolongum]RYQ11355.1 hypothetical protein PG2093B_0464 [Bifidobacterium pseudolongum subsp. globosum]
MNTTNPQRPERDDDTQIIETAEITELDMPMSERLAEFDEATTELPTDASESPTAETTADAPEAPQNPTGTVPPTNAVPLYSSPQSAPQPVRPKGPSAGTIVLGVIVLLCGVLTIAVGVSMSSATFVFFPNMQHFTAYLFAGVGGLLCVLAVVWAIASAIGKRRREQTSPIHESKGARIDR